MSTREASEKWGISERRIQKLCKEGRIPYVIIFGHSWAISENAIKPVDARLKENRKRK
ncbi:MAG: helix-turn-helix domain-containing protein [Clostridium sp.]|nr:helix-turn-helix domain-containing protein [Clostridium sp.]